MNDPIVQTALLGWILPLALTVSILLRGNKDLRHRLYVLFAGNVTIYHFFAFLFVWKGEPWFEKIALCLAVFIPQGGWRFFVSFSTGSHRVMGRVGRVATYFGLLLVALVLIPNMFEAAVKPAVLAYVTGFLLFAILELNQQARSAPTRMDRARIRYLVYGGLLTLSILIGERVSSVLGLDLPPLGVAIIWIYLYVISQTVVRYRVLDLYEMLGRFAVLTLMGMLLAAIYTVLVYWAGRGLTLNAFMASLVILLLFDPLRELVERRIADIFFRERRALELDVHELRKRLAHVIDIELMADVLFSGLENSRRFTHAAMYLLDAHGRGFDLAAHLGDTPELPRIETAVVRRRLAPFESSSAITSSKLKEMHERSLTLPDQDEVGRLDDVLGLLEGMHADVLFPIKGEGQWFGLLALRDERLKEPYSGEEVLLMGGLVEQIAVTIENSHLYQQSKERDRLAALGQMAAGLAHEIRNPLGAIKASAQYIEEVSSDENVDPGEKPEFLSVIVEEVDRLNRVLGDFLTYARPTSGQPQVLDVNEILTRSVQLFKKGGEYDVEISTNFMDDLPGVKIDGEKLHQVFINLILNGVQALKSQADPQFTIATTVRTVWAIREDDSTTVGTLRNVEISFSDNGPGIPLDIQNNIFIPFFTTKEKGSGLGLALCQRIVRDADGDIEVRSQLNSGTIFTVVLPVSDDEEGRRTPQ